MGALKNQRQERYVNALLEGKTSDEAYEIAGYSKNRGNATRMKAKETIQARLAELQNEVARKTEITVESICLELDEANAVARSKGQAAAMVSASALRAKLAGLMVDRVEVGGVGEFSAAETIEDIADTLLSAPIDGFRPVDRKDRAGLVKLLTQHANQVEQYLAAISARPIVASRYSADLKTPWQELPLHPSALIDNRAEERNKLLKAERKAKLR